ncbi:MAG: hypothetical protein RLN75_06650 [Longimicrobiales bacterium]
MPTHLAPAPLALALALALPAAGRDPPAAAATTCWSPGRYRVACTAEGRYLGDAAVLIR